jgi:hypothetical protein
MLSLSLAQQVWSVQRWWHLSDRKGSEANGTSDQEKLGLDDADGNCRQCGHPFAPHLIVAYDVNDFSKGGELRCSVAGCDCFRTLDFDFETST